MNTLPQTPDEYIALLPADRQVVVNLLRDTINTNLPEGFAETISYGMIGWVVPHSVYPAGYHCNPKEPLPFMSLASQKNHVALYHMGLYAIPDLHQWFTSEYQARTQKKIDMAKSCIRFKKTSPMPLELVAELVQKISVTDWIACYEREYARGQASKRKS